MKEILKKVSSVLKTIFGYGIMICLFAGAALVLLGVLGAIIRRNKAA